MARTQASPAVASAIFRLASCLHLPRHYGIFAAASLGDLATYLTTALQLALAFPDPHSGLAGAFAKFAGLFAVTQIPLAISEGLLTVAVINTLQRLNAPELRHLLAFAPARQEVRP